MSSNNRHSRTIESLIGLPDDFAPEKLAPPVDMEMLQAYVNKDPTLSKLECDQIRGNLAHFRSWRKALKEIFTRT